MSGTIYYSLLCRRPGRVPRRCRLEFGSLLWANGTYGCIKGQGISAQLAIEEGLEPRGR